MRVYSFPPITSGAATRLILGSMPGKASLEARQYYAHPRNYFWRMMSSVLNVPAEASYEMRCQALVEQRVALWDVLKTCERSTSLDVDIVDSSIIPNDFEMFLSQHAGIRTIFFNGAKAEKTYLRHVYPELSECFAGIRLVRLPSTSPANASIPFEKKLQQWQQVRQAL